jgi:membrane-associated protease RseP (regulator of RpoE activity)
MPPFIDRRSKTKMAEEYGLPDQPIEMKPAGAPAAPDAAIDVMIRAAREVMTIQDTTRGPKENPIRIRGTLHVLPAEAFTRLRPQFEAVGHTPLLRRADDVDVIAAMPAVFEKVKPGFPMTALLLFVLTVISVFYTGMSQTEGLYIFPHDAIIYKMTGSAGGINPELLPSDAVYQSMLLMGLQYTLALLGILGAHEMGHYLVARYHKVHTTPPFFIPMPLSILGTLGAVIAMREPAPNRRIQFDIGIAGPLAGLIVAVPVMYIGLLNTPIRSSQDFIDSLPDAYLEENPSISILHEGQSIAYLAMKYLVYGRIVPDGEQDVWLHPITFAAWAGFLVTALNLLPVGQLDGGHILFGLLGDRARKWRIPILVAVVVLALSGTVRDLALTGEIAGTPLLEKLPGWSGWWLWAAIIYFMLRNHAPVLDEITGLDTNRKVLGIAMLVVFLLLFMPTPIILEQIRTALIMVLPFV